MLYLSLYRYGNITDVVLDKVDMRALISFQATDQAVSAVNDLKVRPVIMNKRLMVSLSNI